MCLGNGWEPIRDVVVHLRLEIIMKWFQLGARIRIDAHSRLNVLSMLNNVERIKIP